VVQVKIPDDRIRGLNGRRDVDRVLDDDLPLDTNFKVRRNIDLSQAALNGQASGEKGCLLHGKGDELAKRYYTRWEKSDL
jgi:hypothetical protein